MSDNPADSLRREQLDKMTEAGTGAILASVFGEDQRASYWWDIVSIALDRGMLPLIEAVLEAARADERERINQPRDRAMRAARELASLTAEEWRVLEAFEPTKVNELRALLAHPPARGGV